MLAQKKVYNETLKIVTFAVINFGFLRGLEQPVTFTFTQDNQKIIDMDIT